MGKIFNNAGPCNPKKHYMLPGMERLPEVRQLIEDETYFVLHAQRQCGKTTAVRELMREINENNERVAMYCTLEVVQAFPNPEDGLPMIYEKIRGEALHHAVLKECPALEKTYEDFSPIFIATQGIQSLLSELSIFAKKPLVLFFDEIDCLSGATLVTFLSQLRDGRVMQTTTDMPFPSSIALIGMRNIRDYKAQVRPDSETLGSASPFNVITKAMTLRNFTLDEVRRLYQQHTDETGQVFEDGVIELAFEFSQGQPYLVNALAKWCVDEIHKRNYAEPITLEDMHEAKEKSYVSVVRTLTPCWSA